MRLAAVALLVAAALDPAPRTFDMVAFFTGKTHADNVIKVALPAGDVGTFDF